ncbi:hypothetical protein [Massilia sp. Se16.2.3]|uniref:hypothetical protein n=1 Tax=Massilia sp. Se16.2.3 TaxID=2709303 RepID=UPI0016009EEB|nr:hypothetical protein [Massilia sp. Se16.2.3]QNA99149.1 hypothetical protein G4G31_10280 [Massilia sp. Se16.2.3]
MNEAVDESHIRSRQRCPDGQSPPLETPDLARGLLSAHHAEVVAKRQRQRLEVARYQDGARELAPHTPGTIPPSAATWKKSGASSSTSA